ncbi:MAG: hypothetical protein OXI88_21450 [Gammaproteobacteria bacterium]|nr:hypothetical protein [Gammaproteobacteria bacterium]MDE0514337.1 hypothetical protein [Gammaproteobacteria bacterium]
MYGRRLVILLILGPAAFGARADKTPLLLSCHGVPKTDAAIVATLCDALAAELDERGPARVIRRSAAPDPLPGRAWNVVLEVTRTEDYHWEAHLTWGKTGRRTNRQDSRFARRQPPVGLHPGKDATSDGIRATGPDVEMFGMDAPLGRGAYSHFVRSLLKVSKPEFLASPRSVNGPFQGISGSSNN